MFSEKLNVLNFNLHNVQIPNFSSYVFSDIIATFLMGIVAFTCIKYYFRLKYPHLLYLGLAWVFATIANVFYTLSTMFLSIPLMIIDMNLIPFEVFFTILLADYIVRDSIDPWKIFPFAFISGAFILSSYDTSNYMIGQYPDGDWTVFYSRGMTGTLFTVLSLFWVLIFFYLFGKIAFEAPKYLKNKAYLNFLSIFLLAVRGVLFDSLNHISPFLNVPILIIGISLQVFTFIIYPQLAFCLSKKVIKLDVIDSLSGMSLFIYDWLDEKSISQARFSGLMHGLNILLQDSIKRGNLDMIALEKGVLLIERIPQSPLIFILVASKTQFVIRQSLREFARKFVKIYPLKDDRVIDVHEFQSANDLIEQCFPFVPNFKIPVERK